MTDGAKPALPLFVFDFDGVVCDSTDECLVTSWNAWEQWQGGTGFRTAVADFSAAECERFRALRPRVRGAGEYYILRRSFAEGIAIPDQRTYEGLMAQWKAHIAPFAKFFFEMRDRLRNENLSLWIDLHPMYAEVVAVMAALDRQGRFYIATLKDGKSVRLILARHGIEIAPERLLDESIIKSKLQALDSIRKHAACARTDLVFIDDNATHIVEPHASGYPVWLAAWGVPFPDYLDLAAQRGIRVLETQASLRELAFGENFISTTTR
jgi:phosphoglycolate phosphatase-like HAD superfamily hydrolase